MQGKDNSSTPKNNPYPNTARQKRPVTQQRPPSPGKVNLWSILGKSLLGLSVLAWMITLFTLRYNPPDDNILLKGLITGVSGAIGGLAGAGGIYFNTLYLKAKALELQAAKLEDTRPPIVYLRSFKDDGTEVMSAPVPFWSVREEEQVAAVLGELGPVIAIGKPGEPLPELGAVRVYTGDDDWQQVIMDLMSRAQLVVLRVGTTRSFWWEVQTTLRLVRPERIVFLIPNDTNRATLFYQQAQTYLPCRLPQEITANSGLLERAFQDKISLKGLLYFAPNWTPYYTRLDQRLFRKGNTLNPLPAMLRYAFIPVLQPLNLTFGAMKVTWVNKVFKLMAGCLGVLILILIFVFVYMYVLKL